MNEQIVPSSVSRKPSLMCMEIMCTDYITNVFAFLIYKLRKQLTYINVNYFGTNLKCN